MSRVQILPGPHPAGLQATGLERGGGPVMAVKSSTKKRLMEEGVKEELAHKLADDANMDTIKKMSVEDVATKLGLKTSDSELESVMSVIRQLSASKRRSSGKRVDILRQGSDDVDAPLGETRFNVLNHELSPHHELVPEDEEDESLAPWDLLVSDGNDGTRLRRELLPKILITDPAVQVIKEVHESEDEELRAGWLNNRIIRVIRRSPSAGTHVAYRLVVEGT